VVAGHVSGSQVSIDVVIVSHQSEMDLEHAVGELPSIARVVVVDNASTDGSVERAKATASTVVTNNTNAGFAAGANQGAALGTGKLILFLNPDAAITVGDLQVLVGALTESPDLGIVAPRIRYEDGSEQRVAWPFPSARRAWAEAFGLHRLGRRAKGSEFVIGTCFLVRRDVFEALGGFDTRYWLYGEEADFCRRALDAGWRIAVVDHAHAIHVGGASAPALSELVLEHFERGGERFAREREGSWGLVSYRVAETIGAAARAFAPGRSSRRALHRQRLARNLRSLFTNPTSVPLDNPATASAAHTVVVCSLEPWDEVWRRNQFLARELLTTDPELRILFVEPPFDRIHRWRGGSGAPRAAGFRSVRPDGRVLAFQPTKRWPRLVGPFADRSLRRQVTHATRALGFTTPALWVNDPAYAALATETDWPSLYDITDDWLEAAAPTRVHRRLERNERTLLAGADVVVVCSPRLAASRRPNRPDLRVIPNAVDIDHITTPRPRPFDLPSTPVAAYVGTLHEDRFDVELVADLVAAQPELNVALVGPNALSAASTRRLAALPRVKVLGSRPYAEVPAYLQHADVVIVPHVVTPFTESLDPIKAYECAAVGRPTVAVAVSGFRDIGEPIRAVGREQFVAQVASVLSSMPAPRPAQVPQWSDRGHEFARALDAARTSTSPPGRSPIRVVFVDHCAQLSGGELALARLITGLSRDIQPHVVLGEHGPIEQHLLAAGATVEVMPLDRSVGATHRDEVRIGFDGARRAGATVREIRRLERRIRELRPDVVHTNSLKAAVYGGVAGRLAGVPVVWHIRDRIANDYLPRAAAIAIKSLALVVPNAVVFNSQATREACKVPVRFSVIPSPVIYDGVVGQPTPDPAHGHTAPHFVMLGRLAPWKGQDVFLRAFAAAFPRGRETATIAGAAMFGEDAYAEQLVELARTLDIADRVEFAGFVDDISQLLAKSDAVVHASVLAEPFGQVVVEGMAAGLPVIASGAGGPLEVITDEVDGLLFPPGDVDALANQMQRVATDGLLRARLGAAARRRAQDFTPDRIAAAVEGVWRSVVH
jgi:glycosyltransferase involved in cell wall biosynthesis/GT2 family glycosyltransferase